MDLNKPVFILAQGPSIKTLETWIDEYKDLNVLWASFNRFSIIDPILKKIDKHLNIVYGVNAMRMKEEKENIKKYLSLGGNRIFILNPYQLIYSRTLEIIYKELDFLFNEHLTKTIYHDNRYDNGSLVHAIVTFIDLGYKKFFLFGVDGQIKYKMISDHYKQNNYDNSKEKKMNSGGSLIDDTRKLNKGFKQYTKDIDMKNVEIFNVNPDSHIKCFPIISYDQVKEKYESLSI